jgi:hypothetical protein
VSTLVEERYGRRARSPRRRWLLLAAGLTVVALALGWIGWVTLIRHPDVTWEDISFRIQSDAQVQVTFDVNIGAAPGPGAANSPAGRRTAVCTVQALNTLRTEVGLQDFRVRAGPTGRARVTVTLPTSERATTGLVQACTLG